MREAYSVQELERFDTTRRRLVGNVTGRKRLNSRASELTGGEVALFTELSWIQQITHSFDLGLFQLTLSEKWLIAQIYLV